MSTDQTWGAAPISVTQLNAMARRLIEQRLPLLWVGGEISNLTRASSGHFYFSLKDDRAQVRCVLFRHRMQYIDWAPANGMQVEVRAAPSLYEGRGEFQLNIDFMRRAGLGVLFERFEKLKAKLEAEGLFAPERKRRLPAFACCIGVVTSPAAAALRDVLTTLKRRMPKLSVVLYPSPVQGDGAAQRIVAAISAAAARRECDLLIVCRGGGSIEDLWAFNEEIVARACGVPDSGHFRYRSRDRLHHRRLRCRRACTDADRRGAARDTGSCRASAPAAHAASADAARSRAPARA